MDDTDLDSSFVDKVVQRITQDIKDAAMQGYDAIIGMMMIDGIRKENYYPIYPIIEKNAFDLGIKKLCILAYKSDDDIDVFKNLNYELLFVNTTLLILDHFNNNITHNWNYDADKFLFLSGRPDRNNRIRLLKKYYENDLLKKCEWSFFKPFNQKENEFCRSILYDMSDDDYDKFINLAERKVDNLYENVKDYNKISRKEFLSRSFDFKFRDDWIKAIFYVDKKIYNDTFLSIISESKSLDKSQRFITEKTYKPILNKHPFIISCEVSQYDYLKSLGFKLFEEYMVIDDYGYIHDEEKRLDAIVTNTDFFIKNYKKNIDKINSDIEFNFTHCKDILEENKKLCEYLSTRYSIDDLEISRHCTPQGLINHFFNKMFNL